MFIVSVGHNALFYLLEQGNLSLGNFQGGGGLGVKNAEWDVIEGITGGVESGQSIARDETDNGDLN